MIDRSSLVVGWPSLVDEYLFLVIGWHSLVIGRPSLVIGWPSLVDWAGLHRD